MVHHSGESLTRRIWLMTVCAGLLLLLLSLLPSSFRLVPVGPVVWLPWLFFWRLKAPVGLPLLLWLPFGFLQDALQGLPMGLSVLFYALAAWIIDHYRRWLHKESFIEEWLVFILWVTAMTLLYAMAVALFQGQASYAPALMMDAVMAVLLYPLIHSLCWPTYHALPKSFRHAP